MDTTIAKHQGNILRYLQFCKTDHPSGHDLDIFGENMAEKKASNSTKNQHNYSIKAYQAMLSG
jgi:hypothetical protein